MRRDRNGRGFFVNLGDFAGPGTLQRHEEYLSIISQLPMPHLCVVGNHDLDDADSRRAWREVHGSAQISFACGDVRFVLLDGAPGEVGAVEIEEPPKGVRGPRQETLEFLEQSLRSATEPTRVVMTHMPPFMHGHYAPHENWGFRPLEREFFELLVEHDVRLLCCAHGLAFDLSVVRE